MIRFSHCTAFLVICYAIFFDVAQAQTTTVIPANLAADRIGEYATVEGVVAKVFTSKTGNTFLNIGATYPNQTFTGWIPNSSPVKDSAVLTGSKESTSKSRAESRYTKESPKFGSMQPNRSKLSRLWVTGFKAGRG
jgi:hypothetical protein